MTTLTLDGLTAKQQKTWASGDYGAIATLIHPMSEALVQAADLSAGSRVLDVATGTGNAALAAARCGCEVVAVDYVPALLDRARERAAAEHLTIKVREADAEQLPCDDGEYDAVVSVVGVMFAPDQERAAAQLTRVCRPGGTIALANWTPAGFIGQLFKTVGRHVPPPAGLRPPPLWGDETRLRELFADRVTDLRVTKRHFVFRFGSATDLVDFFRTHYGPTLKAFEALGEDGGKQLYDDLVELTDRHNAADDGTLKVPAEYVEVLAYVAG
ncbi:MAG TPA: class I SAM-dependent methyltransferase [Actinoplanes sp.]|nr:class I SAM-dependent methyltransferase [Actinoplanes sp.]